MKITKLKCFLVAISLISGWQINAQTNTVPVTNSMTIITTNVWKTMPWYREVNGQFYDPSHSDLWKHLKGLVEVKEILPHAVILQWCEERKILDEQGRVKAVNRIYGKKFMMRNFSLQLVTAGPDGWEANGSMPVGDVTELQDYQAMEIGTTNYNGEVMPLWDCGKEITSQTVTAIITNYPQQAKNKN